MTDAISVSLDSGRSSARPLRPHRGATVLVFGILGLVGCVAIPAAGVLWLVAIISGASAWAMGNTDLARMKEGVADPAGKGMVQAGRICGVIAVVLALSVVALWLIGRFL